MHILKYRSLLAIHLMSSWRAVLAANSTSISVPTSSSSLTTPTINSGATPSPSGILLDTQNSFWFTLIGLSDNTSVPWGVNVSTFNTNLWANGQVDPNFKAYQIVVNNTNPVPSNAPELGNDYPPFQKPEVIAVSGDTHDRQGSLVVTTDGDQTLVLGLNSYLNYTRAVYFDDLIVPTVPFGLNYGHYGVWNGSITLGGTYDANRVDSSSWTLINETAAGNSTFLQNGTLEITASLEFRDTVTTFPTILDINEESLILPSSYICSQALIENLIVGIPNPSLPDSLLKIVVPSNLTSSPSRCINLKSHDPHNNRVILGRPFFQASYIYVDRDSRIFITAAHQYDLEISNTPFNANATLIPVPQPTQPINPTSPTSSQKSAGTLGITSPSQIGCFGVGWSLSLLAFVATLVATIL